MLSDPVRYVRDSDTLRVRSFRHRRRWRNVCRGPSVGHGIVAALADRVVVIVTDA